MIKPVMSHIPENQITLIIQKRSDLLYNHSITYCSITPFFSPKRHLAIFEKLAIYTILLGPPGVLGIWGVGQFIFRELGSTVNYFRGAGEQAHTFGDLGSTAKKLKNKYQAFILSDSLKCRWLLGAIADPINQSNFFPISLHKLS